MSWHEIWQFIKRIPTFRKITHYECVKNANNTCTPHIHAADTRAMRDRRRNGAKGESKRGDTQLYTPQSTQSDALTLSTDCVAKP